MGETPPAAGPVIQVGDPADKHFRRSAPGVEDIAEGADRRDDRDAVITLDETVPHSGGLLLILLPARYVQRPAGEPQQQARNLAVREPGEFPGRPVRRGGQVLHHPVAGAAVCENRRRAGAGRSHIRRRHREFVLVAEGVGAGEPQGRAVQKRHEPGEVKDSATVACRREGTRFASDWYTTPF